MDNVRNVLREITPPIIWRSASCIKHLQNRRKLLSGASAAEDLLFRGDNQLFRKIVADAKVYGEYGVGQSTIWVRNNTNARISCVDSDPKWIEMVKEKVDKTDGIDFIHVDLGPLSEWGRPSGYGHRNKFSHYADALWQSGIKPDTVLIDGRFRVCCVLTSILRGGEGTRIVFDDYIGRPEYHVVEEILEPVESDKRQAAFIVPKSDTLDEARIAAMIESFQLVTE